MNCILFNLPEDVDLFRREQLYIDTIDIKHNYNILDYAASEFNKNVDKQRPHTITSRQ